MGSISCWLWDLHVMASIMLQAERLCTCSNIYNAKHNLSISFHTPLLRQTKHNGWADPVIYSHIANLQKAARCCHVSWKGTKSDPLKQEPAALYIQAFRPNFWVMPMCHYSVDKIKSLTQLGLEMMFNCTALPIHKPTVWNLWSHTGVVISGSFIS